MTQKTPLAEEQLRMAHAWARYWRLMRWMVVVAMLAVAGALTYLHFAGGLITIHMIIATVAGVGFSVLLAAALMLAVFMSAGSGHDEDVGRWDQRG